MKRLLLFLLAGLPIVICAKTTLPEWIQDGYRDRNYPAQEWYTGFAHDRLRSNDDLGSSLKNLERNAQNQLAEGIIVKIQGKTQMENTGRQIQNGSSTMETITTNYRQAVMTATDAITVKTEVKSYYNPSTGEIYAFAYANKYELIGYYKSNLSLNIGQIESFVKTAQDLESNNEKGKARQQLEMAKPIFPKIRYAQDILTALDSDISVEDLQQEKSETLYNTYTQMQARLAQAVHVYVESSEYLFGQKVDLVANKVKAELAKNGCSFTDEANDADFTLRINVTTRSADNYYGIVFCYADTAIELYDSHKQKTVYSDEITQKGGSNSLDKAGRKAMSDVAQKISAELNKWIQ